MNFFGELRETVKETLGFRYEGDISPICTTDLKDKVMTVLETAEKDLQETFKNRPKFAMETKPDVNCCPCSNYMLKWINNLEQTLCGENGERNVSKPME